MRPRCFLKAVQVLDKFYQSPITGMVECKIQGFASSTYVVTFLDGVSIILQCRTRTEEGLEANFSLGRKLLGASVPTIRLLAKEGVISFYEMSKIPGVSYSERLASPGLLVAMPNIGAGLGTLLARLCTPERMTGKNDIAGVTSCLKAAAASEDPLLVPFKAEWESLLGVAHDLEGLPLAFDNGDVSPTNLMVNDEGHVTGLVDWEAGSYFPVGFNLGHLHWILGHGLGENYVPFENAKEIEARFWSSLVDNLPHSVMAIPNVRNKLQLAMKIGTALFATAYGHGAVPFLLFGLRTNLAYTIPWPTSMPP